MSPAPVAGERELILEFESVSYLWALAMVTGHLASTEANPAPIYSKLPFYFIDSRSWSSKRGLI